MVKYYCHACEKEVQDDERCGCGEEWKLVGTLFVIPAFIGVIVCLCKQESILQSVIMFVFWSSLYLCCHFGCKGSQDTRSIIDENNQGLQNDLQNPFLVEDRIQINSSYKHFSPISDQKLQKKQQVLPSTQQPNQSAPSQSKESPLYGSKYLPSYTPPPNLKYSPSQQTNNTIQSPHGTPTTNIDQLKKMYPDELGMENNKKYSKICSNLQTIEEVLYEDSQYNFTSENQKFNIQEEGTKLKEFKWQRKRNRAK